MSNTSPSALQLLLVAVCCWTCAQGLIVTDASHKQTLSLLTLSDDGQQLLHTASTNLSTFNEYTNGIADPTNKRAYALISRPPGLFKSNRSYAVVTIDLTQGSVLSISSTFVVPGIFPYGIALGPEGNVIVSGQTGSVMVYYLVEPLSGNSKPLASLDVKNGFIFPNAMVFDAQHNTLYHPYCDEPEHFVGTVVVDVATGSASLSLPKVAGGDWFRPAVFSPQHSALIGLIRTPHTSNNATLTSYSVATGEFTALGAPIVETADYTFKGADLSADGSEFVLTASKGFLGSGASSLFRIDVATGRLKSVVDFPAGFSPVEFLSKI